MPKMPPKSPLSNEDYAALSAWLTSNTDALMAGLK